MMCIPYRVPLPQLSTWATCREASQNYDSTGQCDVSPSYTLREGQGAVLPHSRKQSRFPQSRGSSRTLDRDGWSEVQGPAHALWEGRCPCWVGRARTLVGVTLPSEDTQKSRSKCIREVETRSPELHPAWPAPNAM